MTIDPRDETLAVRAVAFGDIDRRDWVRLLEATSAATPFSSWTFHRAWWDAYGDGAEAHYLLIGEEPIRGIVPLMIRGAAQGSGHELHLAATYHADYATALAADDDLAFVAEATVDYLGRHSTAGPAWRVADLRRLRAGDAFLGLLESSAARRGAEFGWTVERVQEDVCPSVSLSGDWSEQLASLGKKTRHEVRRKLRRAQAQGPLRLRYAQLDDDAVAGFIDLHQARWGAKGLFADTDDGRQSRRFLRRLVELEAAGEAVAGLHIGEVVAGDRVIYMLAGFTSGTTCYFYNAGMDPESLHLSPGVVGTALYLRDRIAAGQAHFDFLRGSEPYKYDWGATDKPLYRLRITPRGAW